jgi:hypothetical protein
MDTAAHLTAAGHLRSASAPQREHGPHPPSIAVYRSVGISYTFTREGGGAINIRCFIVAFHNVMMLQYRYFVNRLLGLFEGSPHLNRPGSVLGALRRTRTVDAFLASDGKSIT